MFIVSSFLLLTACGTNEQTAEELIRYHNEDWTALVEKRNSALNDNSSELIYLEETEGKQAGNEYLENVILPELEDFLDVESAIEINDDSVKKLHDLLIDADEFVYNTLKDKGTAYYNGEIDGAELFEATEEGKVLYDKFFDYRDKLMEENDLAIDQVMNDKGSYDQIMMDESEAKNSESIKWGTQ